MSNGHKAERAWVDGLRLVGRAVAHGKKLVIRRHNKQTDHCPSPDAVGLFSIEVKERSIAFTHPGDYPYETVFVDDLRGLGRESIKHLVYVFSSKPTGQWVWLTPLDRDERWVEQEVFDRGRGHAVPMLVAPKDCLRAADTLITFLYPHGQLELVDADTGGFVAGGGEVEERDCHAEKNDPAPRSRGAKASRKNNQRLG
ncbi:MAG: hypothetical protein EBR82_54895 [Caulobacteraceae bacterium]|nr:hypothetical protein [Caulobacteraceae bacterium]